MPEYHIVECPICGTLAKMEFHRYGGGTDGKYEEPRSWYRETGFCSATCYGESLVMKGQAIIDNREHPPIYDPKPDWRSALKRFLGESS